MASLARHGPLLYQRPLTRGWHSSSIDTRGGFQGSERVGTAKRTWPSPQEGRDVSTFIERITGSQVGGATETLQTYESDELGYLLGVEE